LNIHRYVVMDAISYKLKVKIVHRLLLHVVMCFYNDEGFSYNTSS
jgi:hypothetical protein